MSIGLAGVSLLTFLREAQIRFDRLWSVHMVVTTGSTDWLVYLMVIRVGPVGPASGFKMPNMYGTFNVEWTGFMKCTVGRKAWVNVKATFILLLILVIVLGPRLNGSLRLLSMLVVLYPEDVV